MRALERRLGQEHAELLAAEARRNVDVADVLAQRIGEGLQELVPDRVAEAVVDALEVVEVGEDERRRHRPGRPADLGAERGHEAPPVDEARELVGDRLVLDDVMEPRVLERDRGLGGQPDREPLRLRGRSRRRAR